MSENTVRKIGRYEIEREIGQGGMAVVYQALDPRLGRSVAIKLIKRDAFAPSYFGMILERFKREAMALARLDHPNIVKILDYGEHEGAPYLVMNYIVGTTLRDIRKPIRVETAVKLLRPIVEALDYVHEQGLVHRDIKPSNIMLTKQNHVILTDFGIAKWIDDDNEMATLTGTGVGIGTPEYMAPEQGRGAKLDGRSDLYSLSVIFYELITGVKPFTGATPVDILVRQATEPIPDPRSIVPGISPSVKRFLDRAMAKNPDDRYPTSADFLRDFDGLRLESIAQSAHPGTNPSGIRTIERGNDASSSGSSVQIKQSDVERVRQASAQTHDQAPKRRKRTPWIAVLVGLTLVAAFVFGGLQLRSNRAREWEMATKTEAAQLSEPPALSQAEQLAVVKQTVQFETGLTQTQDALSNPSATPIPTDTVTPTASQTAIRAQDLTATQDALLAAAQRTVEKTVSYAQTQAQAATEQARHAATEQTEIEAAIYALGLTETAKAATETASFVQAQTQAAETPVPTAEPNPYASLKIGDVITFGRYEQDNDLENGKEPIEWEVLDVGKGSAVLISRYGLECLPYHNSARKVTWEESSLNRFLQREFFNDTFLVDEQQYLLKSEIDSNGFYVAAENEGTGVDVFILGTEEIRSYFRGSSARLTEPTKYAASKGAWTGTNGTVWWWVREDAKVGSVSAIGADGSIKDPGREVTYKGMAVRPVIRIRTPETVASEKEQLPPLSERLKDLKTGDRVLLGEFFQDTSYLNGMESIEWRVLEVADGSALLLSEYLLTAKSYHDHSVGVTWEGSSLRRWLNEDFFENVFTDEEKNVIALSKLTNPRNPSFGTNGGNDTQDFVFLLNLEEVEKYLSTDEERIAKPTDYALGHESAVNSRTGGGWWWLRSPGDSQNYAAGVYSAGGIYNPGNIVDDHADSVRPALRIKLE